MTRALSVDNVLNAKFNGLKFSNEWKELIGVPERSKSWIIWGQSGSGKTTFNMQLAKYLSSFETVLYNSMEEGLSMSIQAAYDRVCLTKGNKVLLIQESMPELVARLEKHKSPNIVFIDSIRYTRMKWTDYEELLRKFPNKLFIWIGHAKGKEPKGALAEDIRYDAFVKIYVEGYRAFVTSRYRVGGVSSYDIWPQGASRYYGEL